MLRIPDRALSAEALAELAELQRALDAVPDFAARVATGKSEWTRQRKRDASALGPEKAVVLALRGMCFGVERCMYCEDSAGHQIEHVRPKHHYPERIFDWANMLYACMPCNGPKSARFAIVRDADGVEVDLGCPEPPVAPPPGRPLLIDPRTEDPLDFFELDVCGTGRFAIRPGLSAADERRAEYTRDTLHLNTRGPLPEARKQAYGNFRARLREYVAEKHEVMEGRADPAVLDRLRDELLALNHPTVWVEMVRQADTIAELRPLFDAAPEARTWRPQPGNARQATPPADPPNDRR